MSQYEFIDKRVHPFITTFPSVKTVRYAVALVRM